MTATTRHTVALDVMGADNGSRPIIEGGIAAARRLGEKLHVVLVGRREKIEPVIEASEPQLSNVSIADAEQVVSMDMAATDGARMKNSSIAVALSLVKEGRADAFVSPGNTGAVMASALLRLGRIEGVARPAITGVFPTVTGRPTVLLDVGANADCRPQHLSQFAVMGSVYSSAMFKHEAPRVGLLSIGEERSKGHDLVVQTYQLLKDSEINFVGNVEGRDILSGTVDVVVTDGFTGNIMLKFAESIQPMLVHKLQRQIQTNIFSRVAVMFMVPFLKRMKKMFDYSEYGGAPLLGTDGIVIICHGNSNAKAIRNAVVVAHEMVDKKVKQRIHDDIISNHFGGNNGSKGKSEDSRDGVVCASAANDQR